MARFENVRPLSAGGVHPDTVHFAAERAPAMAASTYAAQVQAVIDHILAGDIFQANISHCLAAEFTASPALGMGLFAKMMRGGVAPYAAYLPVPGGAVLSNSPGAFPSRRWATCVGRADQGNPSPGGDPGRGPGLGPGPDSR